MITKFDLNERYNSDFMKQIKNSDMIFVDKKERIV